MYFVESLFYGFSQSKQDLCVITLRTDPYIEEWDTSQHKMRKKEASWKVGNQAGNSCEEIRLYSPRGFSEEWFWMLQFFSQAGLGDKIQSTR